MQGERAARMGYSALVALTAALISQAAHAIAGGMTHPLGQVLFIGALLVLPTYGMLGARRAPVRAMLALVGCQAALHGAWTLLDQSAPSLRIAAQHCGHPDAVVTAGHGMQMVMSPLTMLLAHAAATVVTGYLLLRADRDLTTALSMITDRIPGPVEVLLAQLHTSFAIIALRVASPLRRFDGRAPPVFC